MLISNTQIIKKLDIILYATGISMRNQSLTQLLPKDPMLEYTKAAYISIMTLLSINESSFQRIKDDFEKSVDY